MSHALIANRRIFTPNKENALPVVQCRLLGRHHHPSVRDIDLVVSYIWFIIIFAISVSLYEYKG